MATMTQLQEKQMKMAEELLFSGEPKVSFAKRLYFGVYETDSVLPFPVASDADSRQADAFLEELDVWADKHFDPDWIDRNAEIPPHVFEGLGKLGIMGLTVPKEYGGKGMKQTTYCRAMENIASRCGGTAVMINAHHSIGLRAMLMFGTEEHRMKYLAPLAKGEQIAAFALTEPNAGSDAAGVETRADYDPVKNVYRITGKKQWITNGGIASVLTVMAQTKVDTPTGPEDKITAFLVTPDMPGFKVTEKALEKVGIRGTMTAKLEFDNMEVPAANIVGPKGGGLKVALTMLDFGRLTFGASCTGIAKRCVQDTIEHAKKRIQFERPLASFALVKQKIANMAALSYAMNATTYLTAGMIDRGDEDLMLETAILKVFNSDSLWTIVNDTIQIMGGRAFFCDLPYERMMRDARLNMIGEGSNEVLRAFIGVVGMRDVAKQLEKVANAAKNPITGMGTLAGFAKRMLGQFFSTPTIPIRSHLIASEGRALAAAVRRLGLAIPRLLAKYREGILEEQLVLNRIATSVIAIYTTTAVLGKLDADLVRVGGNAAALGNDLAVAKLYCQEAFATIDRNLGSLRANNDADVIKVANLLTGMA